MRTTFGLILGLVGYGAWKLSEPGPGESPDFQARIARLQMEWRKALDSGRDAGEAKRRQMEAELEAVFRK